MPASSMEDRESEMDSTLEAQEGLLEAQQRISTSTKGTATQITTFNKCPHSMALSYFI